MFKFFPGQVRIAWWPVTWKAATEDGEVIENRIEMLFKLHDDVEYQTLTTETAARFDESWAGLTGTDREVAQRDARANFTFELASAWRGIGDEHEAPLPFDHANLASFLQLPGVSTAVLTAHAAARLGARPNG